MITKIIKRLRKKIKANRKDIDTCMQALVAMQQEQLHIIQRFESHIAFHIDREITKADNNVMCL
jgi:hypothetical protein